MVPVDDNQIVLQWVNTHNLKNIDVTLPKNEIITITWVSGSGKSSLAFDTIYKEGQFRYIESLSSYLRQFFNLGARPDIEYSSGLSPAIAIEQNKRVGNSRSTVGTLTELDDYLRLLMAKLGQVFCYSCGAPLRPKTTEQIVQDIKAKFFGQKVYLLQEIGEFTDPRDVTKWVRKNRNKVDAGEGVTRILVALGFDAEENNREDLVEYFYLEDPVLPEDMLPVKLFGVYDRVTINDSTVRRLKDDVIKMLSRSEKFGVYAVDGQDVDGEVSLPNEQTVDYYEQNFGTYVEENGHLQESVQRWLDASIEQIKEWGTVLELGSGLGLDADYLESEWLKVMRSDITSVFIKHLESEWHDVATIDARTFELKKKFDAIVADAVLLHFDMEEFQESLLSINAHLKQRGVFAFTVREGDGALIKENDRGQRFFQYWQMDILQSVLERYGFKLVSHTKELVGGHVWLNVIAKKAKSIADTQAIDDLFVKAEPALDLGLIWYTDKYYCATDNISYPEFAPHHFSPNRQEWACEKCHGIGEILQVDFDKVLDPMSLYLEAILPWRDSNLGQAILKKLAYKYQIHEETVWKDLPLWYREVVLNGDDELLKVNIWGGKYVSMYYKGVEDVLTSQYNKGVLTVDFQAMLDMRPCPSCHGSRLKKESMSVFLVPGEIEGKDGKLMDAESIEEKYTIYDLQLMPIEQLEKVMERYWKATNAPGELVGRIIKPLLDRAGTITKLGLGYLQTSRQIDTLSGGEIQRLRLAKQLGNKLTGIIYVLDEPTIGLNEREILKVIESIKSLKEMGNTIVVVEHNEEFIKASDRVVEIGPGSGDFGGKLVFNGTYKDFLKQDSLTADYITGKKKVHIDFEHSPSRVSVDIKKASRHNLKGIDVSIKLGSFTIITWPSGAGKTTLMYHTLFKFLSDKQQWIQSYIRLQLLKEGMSWQDIIQAPVMKREKFEHLEKLAVQEYYTHLWVETITGYEEIENVLYVDQSSIGKTPRSCPATFVGVFDDIRKIYAGTTEAKMLAFNSGHFSFNSSKGACPECKWYGYKKVELQFLPDTYVPCNLCKGRRYKPEILDIKWHGKTISEVLEMYVMDALEFFEDLPFIHDKLKLMVDIGLGYLRMGQPAHTMSGGESQRIKLVKHLLKQYRGHTIYFLDEPTVGLHPSDIEKLLKVIKKFLDNGDTILMIEHEKSLLSFADKVIALDDGKLVKLKK